MFNKGKKRNYRPRKQKEEDVNEEEVKEDEKEESVVSSLQERKELQSFRKRPTGVSAESLLVGEKIEIKKAIDKSDPFKIKSGGGLTDMTAKKATTAPISELGTAFSTETNQRDEDVQLLKYIEEGLKKKRGEDETTEGKSRYLISLFQKFFCLCFNFNITQPFEFIHIV